METNQLYKLKPELHGLFDVWVSFKGNVVKETHKNPKVKHSLDNLVLPLDGWMKELNIKRRLTCLTSSYVEPIHS